MAEDATCLFSVDWVTNMATPGRDGGPRGWLGQFHTTKNDQVVTDRGLCSLVRVIKLLCKCDYNKMGKRETLKPTPVDDHLIKRLCRAATRSFTFTHGIEARLRTTGLPYLFRRKSGRRNATIRSRKLRREYVGNYLEPNSRDERFPVIKHTCTLIIYNFPMTTTEVA